jgi:hypothetical protein
VLTLLAESRASQDALQRASYLRMKNGTGQTSIILVGRVHTACL